MAVPKRTDRDAAQRRLGIVGAGQLARMLCEAASALGVTTVVLAQDRDDSATGVAAEVVVGAATDPDALAALAERCDVVTFDHELVDLPSLRALEQRGVAVRPSAAALEAAVDKAHQRERFLSASLPVPRFTVLRASPDEDAEALTAFADAVGTVPVVKAARGGYDGRGVVVAPTLDVARDAALAWRARGVEVVAEERVAFRSELAALVARRPGGELVSWRPVRTTQVDGVCHEVRVPGGVDERTAERARALAREVASLLPAVGVLAVELFEADDGALLVNEVALRPHNSGHWTIEGAVTSQFENHVRAVLDLPLGATGLTAAAIATVNVFGGPSAPSSDALAVALEEPTARVHLYAKAPRAGRKLGHVTVLGDDEDDAAARAWRAASALGTPVVEAAGVGR